jgi:hypothetical protein
MYIADCVTKSRNATFGEGYAQNVICCWDVAAAHLCMEDALRHRPDQVGGDAFLVTGQPEAYSFGDTRKLLQVKMTLFTLFAESRERRRR